MATALLVGLVFLATALDRNGSMIEDSGPATKAMALVFLIALCVAIWTDLARAFK